MGSAKTIIPPLGVKGKIMFQVLKHRRVLHTFAQITEMFANRPPGPIRATDVLTVGGALFGFVQERIGEHSEDVFVDNGWEKVYELPRFMKKFIESHAQQAGALDITIQWDPVKILLYHIDGAWVGLYQEKDSTISRPADCWVYPSLEVLYEKIRDLSCSVSERWVISGEGDENLEVDSSPLGLPGKRSGEIADRLSNYLSRGISRSLMLHGPPGTGKSIMARQIASKLCHGYFRVANVRSLTFKSWNLLYKWAPKAIIFEDVDHHSMDGELLSVIERQREVTPCIIFTSNSVGKLRGAFRRPGRIDLFEYIDELDEELFKSISKPIPERHLETVRKFPVAYLNELVLRIETEGPSQVEKWVGELSERIDNVGDGWG